MATTNETRTVTAALDRNGVWRLDQTRSTLSFRIRKFFWHPKGYFEAFDATLERPVSGDVHAALRVEARSVCTGIGLRDAHLRSRHFFDVTRHPQIAFESTSVEAAGANRLRIKGDLAIRGTRRPYEIEATVESSDDQVRLRASGIVERKAFGVGAPAFIEMGGLMLGRTVEFVLDVTFHRAPDELA